MTIGQRRRGVGVEVLPDGSVHARVWAPYARSVAVVFEDGSGTHPEPVALTAEERGVLLGVPAPGRTGTRYRLRLDDQTLVADPASRLQPEGVYGPSMVVDPAEFTWEVDAWQVPTFRDWVLYELHVGTFTPEGTFDAAIAAAAISQGARRDRHRADAGGAVPRRAELGLRRRLPLRRPEALRRPRRALRRLVDACTARARGGPRRGLQPPRARGQLPRATSAPTSPTATARRGATL